MPPCRASSSTPVGTPIRVWQEVGRAATHAHVNAPAARTQDRALQRWHGAPRADASIHATAQRAVRRGRAGRAFVLFAERRRECRARATQPQRDQGAHRRAQRARVVELTARAEEEGRPAEGEPDDEEDRDMSRPFRTS